MNQEPLGPSAKQPTRSEEFKLLIHGVREAKKITKRIIFNHRGRIIRGEKKT